MSASRTEQTAQAPFDSLMEITSRPHVVFVEGRGSWLRDQTARTIWISSRAGR